jgi:cephalosporin-C deacetylase
MLIPIAAARDPRIAMALFDLPLAQLITYRPSREEPADFDAFWAETLDEARSARRPTSFEPAYPELASLEVLDVTFSGHAGERIKAWLLLPRHADRPLPTVVEYIGYGGGRGLPTQWLTRVVAGYAHFVMDTRGQGSMWTTGDTPDAEPPGSNPQYPGFMTRGILDPRTYFYRRLFGDATMAIAAARDHEAVDRERVIVAGGSQGGGIGLAAAALDGTVAAALIDVPFLCHFRRALEITDEPPYVELRSYLAVHRSREEQVFRTLSYVDGMNFAARARTPLLMSVGLMDAICPPSTVFAAYNHWAGPKEIRVWPYNGHDAGQGPHVLEQYRFLDALGLAP